MATPLPAGTILTLNGQVILTLAAALDAVPPVVPPDPPDPPEPQPPGQRKVAFGASGIATAATLTKYPYWNAALPLALLTPDTCQKSLDDFGPLALLNIRLWRDADAVVDGKFSMAGWKASINRYAAHFTFLNNQAVGGRLMHMLLDDIEKMDRWGHVFTSEEIDDMARYSHEKIPNLLTMMRARPAQLDGYQFKHLQNITSSYLYGRGGKPAGGRKADCVAWLRQELDGMKAYPSTMSFSVILNWVNGGDGSSKLPGSITGKFMMSAPELREYADILVPNSTRAFGGWEWGEGGKYDASYFDRKDIGDSMTYIRGLCDQHTW